MTEKKVLTLKGLTPPNFFLIISAILMVSASIYLMHHHFITFYPSSLSSSALCNISNFFNCDAVAFSPIATILEVPISLFGCLAGIFLIISSIFPTIEAEGTNNFLTKINFLGCLLLFAYSLFILNHLCPICTLYYIFSGVACYLFWKNSELKKPSWKVLVIYFIITSIAFISTKAYTSYKKRLISHMAGPVIKSFNTLPVLGNPKTDSPFRNVSSSEAFNQAPLQISVFSDFQCPFCIKLAQYMPLLASRYKNLINVQFYFYPLDNECNPNATSSMHPLACKASYLASCSADSFASIHDKIFEHANSLTEKWINNYAKELGLYNCMNSRSTKEKVVNQINEADMFNIDSTPTMIINGRKLKGFLPITHLYIILDYLAKTNEK